MDKIKNNIKKIKTYFESNQNKKTMLLLFIGLSGIMLIMISDWFTKIETKNDKSFSSDTSEFFENDEDLENRLEDAISKIKGAGKTEVTITFESSKELCFAENFAENKDDSEHSNENEFVIIEGEKGENALLIKTYEAKIRGVLIVCEGGNDPLLKEKIIKSVSALLDIPSNKVNVAEMA